MSRKCIWVSKAHGKQIVTHVTDVIPPPSSMLLHPSCLPLKENYPKHISLFSSHYNACKDAVRSLYQTYSKAPKLAISQFDFFWVKASIPSQYVSTFYSEMRSRGIVVVDNDMTMYPSRWGGLPVYKCLNPIKIEVTPIPSSGCFLLFIDASICNIEGDFPTVAYATVIIDANFNLWAYYTEPEIIHKGNWLKDQFIMLCELNGLEFACSRVVHSIRTGRLPIRPNFDIKSDSYMLVKYMGNTELPADVYLQKIYELKKTCASVFGSYTFSLVHREGNRLADALAHKMARKMDKFKDAIVVPGFLHSYLRPGFRISLNSNGKNWHAGFHERLNEQGPVHVPSQSNTPVKRSPELGAQLGSSAVLSPTEHHQIQNLQWGLR